MRLSDHAGPLEVPRGLSFGLLLFGFALEGEGFLKLLGNMEPIEAARSSDHRLEGNHMDSQPITTSGKYFICLFYSFLYEHWVCLSCDESQHKVLNSDY